MATKVQMTEARSVPTRDCRSWVGWALSGLTVAFLLMDATMKLLALPVVLEASAPLGFPGADMARGLGTVLLICTLLYASPRTACARCDFADRLILGGAAGNSMCVSAARSSATFFLGVYLGVVLWGGLYLRDNCKVSCVFLPLHKAP